MRRCNGNGYGRVKPTSDRCGLRCVHVPSCVVWALYSALNTLIRLKLTRVDFWSLSPQE